MKLLVASSGLKALAKNTLHILHLLKSKHPLHPHANGSWRHHTDLIGLYIHSHSTDSAGNLIHSQSTKKPSLLYGHITSNYIWNDRGHNACSQMRKGLLCLAFTGEEKKQPPFNAGFPPLKKNCYDYRCESAVSNVQTISTIHSFLESLIDKEWFLCPEPGVSVSSQLVLSVQGHSTSDRTISPWDQTWDGAARHASGAHLQGPTQHSSSTGHSPGWIRQQKTWKKVNRNATFGRFCWHCCDTHTAIMSSIPTEF